jgi:Leucine-rich repeat (LRR) protein
MGRLARAILVWACFLVLASLASGQAGQSTTKVLQFPKDQYVGSLSAEDPCLGSEYLELGRDLSLPLGLDPKRVALGGNWDFVGLAQGDVVVPADRNVSLGVMLQATEADRSRLSADMRRFLSSQVILGPLDLSGLAQLDPNDLYRLTAGSMVSRSDAGTRVLGPISRLTGLQILGLHRTGVTDSQMDYLKPLQSLRGLELSGETSLRNPGLAVLRELPTLEYLDLDTATTDVGLKHLGELQNLRWLRLRMGRIWGRGLAELARMPRLERLALWGTTGLGDRHVSYIEGLTRLKSLTLWGSNYTLTDATLASISKLTSLEELYFIRINTQFSDAGMGHLENLRNLRKISFTFLQIGAEGLQHLANLPHLESVKGLAPRADAARVLPAFRNLKVLDVNWVIPPMGTPVPPEVVAAVGQLHSVEDLSVMGGQWSQEDLLVFGKLTNLKRLRLGMDDDFGDPVLAEIAKLRNLEHLNLSGGTVSKRGLNQLQGLTKLQTLGVRTYSPTEPQIDETPLALSALTSLKTLELTGLDLRNVDLASLMSMCDLEWVVLGGGTLSEVGLQHLRNLVSVKHLTIRGLDCQTGAGLTWLAGLENAASIRLHGRITNVALDHLGGLPSLSGLNIETDEIIRPETVARLRERLPAIMSIKVEEPWRPDAAPIQIQKNSQRPQPGSSRVRRQTPRSRRR